MVGAEVGEEIGEEVGEEVGLSVKKSNPLVANPPSVGTSVAYASPLPKPGSPSTVPAAVGSMLLLPPLPSPPYSVAASVDVEYPEPDIEPDPPLSVAADSDPYPSS